MRGIDAAFWNGRRVFVTGHTGFIGGWLTVWLRRLGAQVFGYSLPPPTDPSFFAAANVAGDVESVIADLRDLGSLRQAMADANPDVVMHLAAQPLVRQAHADPLTTYGTNVMGTVHVLEAMRAMGGVRAAVIMTSDKVYENCELPSGYR